MNTQLFILINNFAGRWPVLDWVMIFCAEYLIWVMGLALVVLAARNYKRWRDPMLVAIVSAGVARGVVAEIIKRTYNHPRPYWVIAETHLLLTREMQSSFPSGHTIFAFAMAMGVYLYDKTWGRWYLVLAALVGFSRVFAGVHWPYDILAGAVLGILTTLVCDRLYRKYKYVIGF
jgi:undecaprenyl-diphosphatase